MKTPLWEPSTGYLVDWLLANLEARPVDLWTITLGDGTVLRYSGTDVPVTVPGLGVTFNLGPTLERGRISRRAGVSVDTLQVAVMAGPADLIGGTPFLRACAAGVLVGSTVDLWRAFLGTDGELKGVIGEFRGRMGDVTDANRHRIQMEVRSWNEVLDTQVPGDVYQAGCRNVLYGVRCGVSRAAFTVSGVLASMDTARRTITSTSGAVVAKPAGWASLGTLRFTSGANVGASRPVRLHSLSAGVATISLIYPFPASASAGDAFTLEAGCDKSVSACETKFVNLSRFRAEKFIPPPETIA